MGEQDTCCQKEKQNKGISSGILFGLIPHSFCIAFILFSIIGAVSAAAFLKNFLLIPNLFYFLIIISLALATISAMIYLKKNDCLCRSGIKKKWKYVATLYSSTVLVNLLMFFVVFPALTNMNSNTPPKTANQKILGEEKNLSDLSISVDIPCSGHASLIIDEIKKNAAVQSVIFEMPNNFDVKYNSKETNPEKILALDIFKTYPAKIN